MEVCVVGVDEGGEGLEGWAGEEVGISSLGVVLVYVDGVIEKSGVLCPVFEEGQQPADGTLHFPGSLRDGVSFDQVREVK